MNAVRLMRAALPPEKFVEWRRLRSEFNLYEADLKVQIAIFHVAFGKFSDQKQAAFSDTLSFHLLSLALPLSARRLPENDEPLKIRVPRFLGKFATCPRSWQLSQVKRYLRVFYQKFTVSLSLWLSTYE